MTFEPAPFAVFVTFKHKGQPTQRRIGNYRTLDEARTAIADERKPGETFGGLIGSIQPDPARGYRIFRATWEEIQA